MRAIMGRRRKNSDSGLEPRVYAKHGAFYYVHRDGRWERLSTDMATANRKAKVYNDPGGMYGTVVYWMDRFMIECEQRVAAGTMSQRTLDDYRDAIEIRQRKDGQDAKTGLLRTFFAPPMTPADVTPNHVALFLSEGAKAGRAVRANRDKACFSAFMSWLILTGEVPELIVNPCLRSSGVKRNPEKKRARYVTHDEYQEVWAVATRAERLLMSLTYRTLQRPESDIILWDANKVVSNESTGRFLRFKQNKTGQDMVIAVSSELDSLIPRPVGNVRRLVEPLVKRLDGDFYTYDGLSSMLKRSIETANARRKARGLTPMAPFGYRDLKGKGATDMWQAGVPIEQIQALLGHASKTTTEIYIKQRWTEAVQPNNIAVI